LIRGRFGRPPAENEPLTRLVREAWSDGPPAPSVDRLLAALRPGVARIDRELEELGEARPAWLSVLRGLFAPAAVGGLAGAAAVAVLALVMLQGESGVAPTIGATAQGPLTTAAVLPAADDASPITDLHSSQPLLVFEGDDGATVIWVVEGNDDSSMNVTLAGNG
jgi:hypothetical protein